MLKDLSSGTHKIEIKAKHVYFEEKVVNLDLSSANSLNDEKQQYQHILALKKFVANSFDVCGQIKIIRDQTNANLVNDVLKSTQIKIYHVQKSNAEETLLLVKTLNIDENFGFCHALESNKVYSIKADLNHPSLLQVLKLVPEEKRVTVSNSHIMNIDFEQLEAKLEGRIKFLAKQSVAPNDLILYFKAADSNRQFSKELLVKCQTIKKEEKSEILCLFSLTNLLFGNYILTTNYDDVYCWKKFDESLKDNQAIVININSQLKNIVLEQVGYKLNYELTHKNAVVKIVEAGNENAILYSRNIQNNNDLVGNLCVPELKNYELIIDSCHSYRLDSPHLKESSKVNLITINQDMFKRNSNKLKLVAFKNLLKAEIIFKLENLNDKKRFSSKDLYIEVAYKNQNGSQVEKVDLSVKSESDNEIVLTGNGWFEMNQQLNIAAKSNKLLFDVSEKELIINEQNCDLNRVEFEAKLGIFIVGSIKPIDIDDISLKLISNIQNSTIYETTINAAQGFKLGPLKSPSSQYDVELNKAGYIITKVANDEDETSKDIYRIDYKAKKLGQLKVNVFDKKSKENLENVLVSLSSENRVFRQTIKTNRTGYVSFDNLKPGLYYLIVMMQEYEFKPNSHQIEITDGFQMNLAIEANRIAYSCLGRVTSINGLPEKDLLVEAIGIKSHSGSDVESDLCRGSQENSAIDSITGSYRIPNLKPKCEYKLKVKQLNQNDQNSALSYVKVMPESYNVLINESDVLDRSFIILNKLEKMDITVSVDIKPLGYQQQTTISKNNKQHLNYFVRIKLFKTNQPETILQTQILHASSIFYFNSVNIDDLQQYSVLVELYASSLSTFTLSQQQQAQLQQQSVVEKTEISFYADSIHKHLNAQFDMEKKRNQFFGFDLKQQQYQNFYFTLPLFILIVGLVINSTKVQSSLNVLMNSINSNGGFIKYIQSLLNNSKFPNFNSTNLTANLPTKTTVKVPKPLKKTNNNEEKSSTEEEYVIPSYDEAINLDFKLKKARKT
jgi:hypothetical protein